MPGGGGRIDGPNINQAVVAERPAPAPVKKTAKKSAATSSVDPEPVPDTADD